LYVQHALMPLEERYTSPTELKQALDLAHKGSAPTLCLCCDRRYETTIYQGWNTACDLLPSVPAACLLIMGAATLTMSEFGPPVNHFRALASAMPDCR
jgi:hypothetical protein